MHTNCFTMHFEGIERLELVRSEFRAGGASEPLVVIRGKSPGVFIQYGSFQWTSGVRAVCSAFLRFRLSESNPGVDYCLIGSKGSLAASLDYALSKGPAWLGGMFGVTPGGGLYAKRLFRITNPNRKRPGPVALSVNKSLISGANIQVYWNGEGVTELTALTTILQSIESQVGESTEFEEYLNSGDRHSANPN